MASAVKITNTKKIYNNSGVVTTAAATTIEGVVTNNGVVPDTNDIDRGVVNDGSAKPK